MQSGRGVHFEAPPFRQYETDQVEGWMALFHDPDGNPLVLKADVPKP